MVYDFHTHTSSSDGALSPLELVRRAIVNSYQAIAITDHVAIGYLERLIAETVADCDLIRKHWNFIAIPGVELTHLPVTDRSNREDSQGTGRQARCRSRRDSLRAR